jgi:hypothetical protein
MELWVCFLFNSPLSVLTLLLFCFHTLYASLFVIYFNKLESLKACLCWCISSMCCIMSVHYIDNDHKAPHDTG